MHAAIRHDLGTGWSAAQTVRAARALTAALAPLPGFIFCALIATDDGDLASICVCEQTADLDTACRLLADWLATQLATTATYPPRIITGEVIVQRGL